MEDKDLEAEIHPLKTEEGAQEGRERLQAPEGPLAKSASKAAGLAQWPGRLSRWRTGAFFLSLFLCLVAVLAFSFVIPCPVRPISQTTWNRTYDQAATYPFISVADVNQDRVQDVLFAFQAAARQVNGSSSSSSSSSSNSSCSEAGFASPCAFVAAHSGTDGSTLWESLVGEELLLMDCTVELEDTPACLLLGRPDFLAALDLKTGQTLWHRAGDFGANSTVLRPLLKIPDVNKDGVPDLLFFTRAGDEVKNYFYSGQDGAQIGSTRGLRLPGTLGHFMYVTKSGAHYVVLFSGTAIYAYSVEELFHSALSLPDHRSAALKEDPQWELVVDRTTRKLSFLSSGEILSLREMADKPGGGILVARSNMLELVDGQRLGSMWVADIPHIRREPVLGSYYADAIGMLVESQVSPKEKKVLIVEGASGEVEWEVELLSADRNPRGASLATADHRSAFLFWGLYPEPVNGTEEEKEGQAGQPQKLYLFHPTMPNVLLEMGHHPEEGRIVAFEGVLFEQSRHACYLLLTGPRAGSDPPGRVGLLKRKLKEDIASGRVIWLSQLAQDTDQNIRGRFRRMRYRSPP